MLPDAGDQNAAGVRSASLGQLSQEGSEVVDVEGDHDSLLFRSQGEHVGIIDALQIPALIEGEDIVSPLPEFVGDHPAGDVGVKQQTQRSSPLSS